MKKALQTITGYDAWSRNYDYAFTQRYRYTAPRRTRNALAAKTDITRPGLKILDVGCGTGLLSAELRQANARAYIAGIDISAGMLAKCRKKNIADRLELGDILKPFPFANNSFDITASTGVFELLETPEFVISEMSRTLKTGGFIAFTSPHNWRDRSNTTQKFTLNPNAFFNWLDRGYCHREACLDAAMRNNGITPLGTRQFIGYFKNGGKAPYQLYIGQKLDNP